MYLCTVDLFFKINYANNKDINDKDNSKQTKFKHKGVHNMQCNF